MADWLKSRTRNLLGWLIRLPRDPSEVRGLHDPAGQPSKSFHAASGIFNPARDFLGFQRPPIGRHKDVRVGLKNLATVPRVTIFTAIFARLGENAILLHDPQHDGSLRRYSLAHGRIPPRV